MSTISLKTRSKKKIYILNILNHGKSVILFKYGLLNYLFDVQINYLVFNIL